MRRIVQIAATSIENDDGQVTESLFALDQNGIAWAMIDPITDSGAHARWHRLPALPSIENLARPATPASSLEEEEGAEP
jgi:hypothetical protein